MYLALMNEYLKQDIVIDDINLCITNLSTSEIDKIENDIKTLYYIRKSNKKITNEIDLKIKKYFNAKKNNTKYNTIKKSIEIVRNMVKIRNMSEHKSCKNILNYISLLNDVYVFPIKKENKKLKKKNIIDDILYDEDKKIEFYKFLIDNVLIHDIKNEKESFIDNDFLINFSNFIKTEKKENTKKLFENIKLIYNNKQNSTNRIINYIRIIEEIIAKDENDFERCIYLKSGVIYMKTIEKNNDQIRNCLKSVLQYIYNVDVILKSGSTKIDDELKLINLEDDTTKELLGNFDNVDNVPIYIAEVVSNIMVRCVIRYLIYRTSDTKFIKNS